MAKPSKAKKEMREEANENKRHLSKAENAKEMTKKAREEAKKERDTEIYHRLWPHTEVKQGENAQPTRIYFPPANEAEMAEITKKIREAQMKADKDAEGFKKGGMVKKGYHKMPDGRMMKDSAHKKMAKKSTASKRADGICVKGKTRGRMC